MSNVEYAVWNVRQKHAESVHGTPGDAQTHIDRITGFAPSLIGQLAVVQVPKAEGPWQAPTLDTPTVSE